MRRRNACAPSQRRWESRFETDACAPRAISIFAVRSASTKRSPVGFYAHPVVISISDTDASKDLSTRLVRLDRTLLRRLPERCGIRPKSKFPRAFVVTERGSPCRCIWTYTRLPAPPRKTVAAAHRGRPPHVQRSTESSITNIGLTKSQGRFSAFAARPAQRRRTQVHRVAHGLVAQKIIEVAPEVAEASWAAVKSIEGGAALLPGARNDRDPGVRIVLFTDIVGSTSMTHAFRRPAPPWS